MMRDICHFLLVGFRDTEGQDVAEYAIMLAVVLVIVMGMVRMIGANASTVFSQVASGIQ
jgi:Flp pilus assembly pilin Flp